MKSVLTCQVTKEEEYRKYRCSYKDPINAEAGFLTNLAGFYRFGVVQIPQKSNFRFCHVFVINVIIIII